VVSPGERSGRVAKLLLITDQEQIRTELSELVFLREEAAARRSEHGDTQTDTLITQSMETQTELPITGIHIPYSLSVP